MHATVEANNEGTDPNYKTFQMMTSTVDVHILEEEQNPWNKLNDVMVETVLAQLPTMDILRCRSVCKRWNSIIHSPTFSIASNQLFDRRPWFIIMNITSRTYVVYDTEVLDLRRVQLPITSIVIRDQHLPFLASSGLVFFWSTTDKYSFSVCNPITGSVHFLPRLCLTSSNTTTKYELVAGVAMHVWGGRGSNNYKVFVAFGKWPNVGMKVFSSENKKAAWMELPLGKLIDGYESWPVSQREIIKENLFYGVSAKGVTVIGNEGQVLVHYIISSGILICFDTQKCTICVSPRLPLQRHDCGMELVECGGRVLVVVFMEAVESLATRTLRVWEFDNEKVVWKNIGAMPLHMTQAYHYDTLMNVPCSGYGEYIMVCLNSGFKNHFNQVVIYNIKENSWVELSPQFDYIHYKFVIPYSFKPDIEAQV
ncbi:F-box domain [Macleaya cordata]|uniref:F-box domain n=1 Tax=Macleaya cordata TaxID=56857 RepID=A0A200QIF4_MACCD|nr:F-box domain [Macleaya cordata]